jgi:hypothetical protein
MEFLTRELSQALGLHGKLRNRSVAERAGVTVTKRLKDALRQVERSHPVLGQHLRASIKTGMFCVYAPPAGQGVAWKRPAAP